MNHLTLALLARNQFEGNPEGALTEMEHRVRKFLAEAEKLRDTNGKRPCDCENCECNNSGDTYSVGNWDGANWVLSLLLTPKELGGDNG